MRLRGGVRCFPIDNTHGVLHEGGCVFQTIRRGWHKPRTGQFIGYVETVPLQIFP